MRALSLLGNIYPDQRAQRLDRRSDIHRLFEDAARDIQLTTGFFHQASQVIAGRLFGAEPLDRGRRAARAYEIMARNLYAKRRFQRRQITRLIGYELIDHRLCFLGTSLIDE